MTSAEDTATANTLRTAIRLALVVGPLGWLVFYLIFRVTPGQDWMVFDTAIHAWRNGDTGLLLDGRKFTLVMNRTHEQWLHVPLVFHPWVYPPYTLLLVLPFAYVPWIASYCGFQFLSLAAMLWALRKWCPTGRPTYFIIGGVLLCPATAFTLGAGQNSFLTAALVLGGFHFLDRRRILAGVFLGLLAFKPQLSILVPLALIASGAWRVLAAAIVTATALVAASLAVPGVALWQGWLHLFLSGDPAFKEWVDQGRLHGQSVFTCLKFIGLPAGAANAGQILAILAAAACVWIAFRSGMVAREKLAILLCAMILAAAHVGNYDAILLGIAATLVLAQGFSRPFRRYEAVLAMLVWASTAVNPPFVFYISAVTPAVVLAFMIVLCRPASPAVRNAWPGAGGRDGTSPDLGASAAAVMEQHPA